MDFSLEVRDRVFHERQIESLETGVYYLLVFFGRIPNIPGQPTYVLKGNSMVA